MKRKLSRKRPPPMEREKQLSEILSNFYDLSVENQIEHFSDTCFSIGNLTKTIESSNIINRQPNSIPVNTTVLEISGEISDNSSDESPDE